MKSHIGISHSLFIVLGCGSGVPYPFPESVNELWWESECDSASFTSEEVMINQDCRLTYFSSFVAFVC